MTLQTQAQTAKRYALAIHGGAGEWPELSAEREQAITEALTTALRTGRDILAAGGTSLDAVERTINVLENSPHFNAGKGAVCNAAGEHQLDASIMSGKDRSAGAVAAIGVAKNPISVARRVMTDTPHVLLAGAGANEFARASGVELVDPDYFWTEQSRQEWEKSKSASRAAAVDHYGTVGCVALDMDGSLAAGTSTGGLQGKMVGRVGDSPIIAAGTYADNGTCAVSSTGVGELFIRHAIAYDISARMRYANHSLAKAVDYQIDERLDPGTGGLIALNQDGGAVLRFNTRAMPRGVADSVGRFEVQIAAGSGD
jgi:beta-aspartyl-peptidase (threonine type)